MYSGIVLPHFDPAVLRFGAFAVRWYSLAYIFGFILALCLVKKMAKHTLPTLQKTQLDDLLFYSVLGVVIGGRLGYVLFYNFPYFIHHLSEILMVWLGGMSFHGGLLGMVVVAILFARKQKIPLFVLSDILVAVAPVGLFLGRLANFVNGELLGRVTTSVPWAMIFPTDSLALPRHPSQLYEALGEGVFLGILLNVLWWKSSQCRRHPGVITGLFFALYALLRFGVEFCRAPDPQIGLIAGLSLGQWLCVPMLLFGVSIVVYGMKHSLQKATERKRHEA